MKLKTILKEIKSKGLRPKTGKFLSTAYDNVEPLIFACDKEHLSKAISSILYHIANKLNLKSPLRVTDEMLKEYGCLFTLNNSGFKHRDINDSKYDHPIGVEWNDYYTDKPVKVKSCIQGEKLLKIAKQHGFEYIPPKKSGFTGL